MAVKVSVTLYIIIYWTLSHIMCLKSHWILETKDILWKNEQLAHFGAKLNFYFYPNGYTLKFLKMKCNPTNKKTVA